MKTGGVKRTAAQAEVHEAQGILDRLKEWVKEHPIGNIVNLSSSPKVKKELDDHFSENYDHKKKCRVYMQFNGFMSFVFHYIKKENGIDISQGNEILIGKLVRALFADDTLDDVQYGAFRKMFVPLLDHLTATYRIDTESVLSLEDHVDACKDEKKERDGFLATDPTFRKALMLVLRRIFTLDFKAFKSLTGDGYSFASWDLACWMTCNAKHTFSYDVIVCDPAICYSPLQQSLVDSIKLQNPNAIVICTAFYKNKRVKTK